MFIVDLRCANDHEFEGWYDSAQEYRAIEAANELSCPLCQSVEVERVLSPTAISTTKTRERNATMPLEIQKELARVVQHVRATHEDVGASFATRATAIARGDEEARPIRGTSTPEEEDQMREDGVPFLKVPIPDIEQN